MSDPYQDDLSRPADKSAGAVIAASLVALEQSNSDAHALLVSRCQEGFFEEQQGKRPINQFADQLLATVQSEETSHAD